MKNDRQLTTAILDELMRADPLRKAAALAALRRPLAPAADRGPLLVGMAEASRILGVSRTTFWNLVRAGRFRPVAVTPTCRRIARRDLDEYVAASRVCAAPQPASEGACA
jgi:excisionase family DNA binding protein